MKVESLQDSFGCMLIDESGEDCYRLSRQDVAERLHEFGAVLFRGVSFSEDRGFENFATRLFPRHVSFRADKLLDRLDASMRVISHPHEVFTGRPALAFHTEMAYLPNPPHHLWFHCEVPALTGGQTKLCDGIAVYESLSRSAVEYFERHRICFNIGWGQTWSKHFGTDDPTLVGRLLESESGLEYAFDNERNLRTRWVTSAFQPPYGRHCRAFANPILNAIGDACYGFSMEDGSLPPADVMDELQDVTDRLSFLVDWQRDDVLLIDNTRMMHGRVAYSDSQRRLRALETSYSQEDELALIEAH